MVQTVQTLLHSQLACNEMQALAWTCGRRAADSMIENVGSSQYTFIVPHRVLQPTTTSFWVSETRLQINKFPPKWMKNLVPPSSIFIFSSSTGEVCSQPIRGNDRWIGQIFPERVERSFLDPEYSFDKYFQLGSWRKVGPIKNQLAHQILPTRFVKKHLIIIMYIYHALINALSPIKNGFSPVYEVNKINNSFC